MTEGAVHVDASSRLTELERVPWWDQHALSEVFLRLVLRELRRAERLREETESTLLSWQHSGFHVHAGEPVLPDDTERLEHLARYITRAPIRLDTITPLDAARVVVRTPPDPQIGSQRMKLDVLENRCVGGRSWAGVSTKGGGAVQALRSNESPRNHRKV